jgi:acylphosphatase
VGFRWFVLQSARDLGLAGWVRNREDGAVEGEAQGDEERMTLFLEKLRGGPPQARVDALQTQRLEAENGPAEFEII